MKESPPSNRLASQVLPATSAIIREKIDFSIYLGKFFTDSPFATMKSTRRLIPLPRSGICRSREFLLSNWSKFFFPFYKRLKFKATEAGDCKIQGCINFYTRTLESKIIPFFPFFFTKRIVKWNSRRTFRTLSSRQRDGSGSVNEEGSNYVTNLAGRSRKRKFDSCTRLVLSLVTLE